MLQPEVHLTPVLERAEHHDFMVADQRHQLAAIHQVEEDFDHAEGVRTSVDQVPQGDDGILSVGSDSSQQSCQREIAPMNVANCNCSGH